MRITFAIGGSPLRCCVSRAPRARRPPAAMLSPRRKSRHGLHSADEPGNWMIYGGNYWNQRYSKLKTHHHRKRVA